MKIHHSHIFFSFFLVTTRDKILYHPISITDLSSLSGSSNIKDLSVPCRCTAVKLPCSFHSWPLLSLSLSLCPGWNSLERSPTPKKRQREQQVWAPTSLQKQWKWRRSLWRRTWPESCTRSLWTISSITEALTTMDDASVIPCRHRCSVHC